MSDHRGDEQALLDLCRGAVVDFRLEAFDNVALGSMLAGPVVRDEDARWIGRHLMANARSAAAYAAGQTILRHLTDPSRIGRLEAIRHGDDHAA